MSINCKHQNHDKKEKTPSSHEYKLRMAKSQTKKGKLLARMSINYKRQNKKKVKLLARKSINSEWQNYPKKKKLLTA